MITQANLSIVTDSVEKWRRSSGGGQDEGQSQAKEEEHLKNKAEEVDVRRRMNDGSKMKSAWKSCFMRIDFVLIPSFICALEYFSKFYD